MGHHMIAAYTSMTTDQAHSTYLRWIKAKFKKTKKKHAKPFSQREKGGGGGRFNLKIGTHSSFLQMKARKWKSLESCLVWKSKVMNNVSVSIIKSVLIRWISLAPAGWKTQAAALLTSQEWDKSPSGRWTSHPPPLAPLANRQGWAVANSSGLSFMPMNPPPVCRWRGESSWFTCSC